MAPGITHGRSPQHAGHLLGAPTWQQWEGWRKPEQEMLLSLCSPSLAARTAPPTDPGLGGQQGKGASGGGGGLCVWLYGKFDSLCLPTNQVKH